MSDRGRNVRSAWIVHGVAVALWLALYWYLFGEALFPKEKPWLDLEGFGAVIALEVLLGYLVVSSVVVLFVGRWPLVPLVIHGFAFTMFWAGTESIEQDKRERAEAHALAQARARAEAQQEREREAQAKLAYEAEQDRLEALERQPEGCLHVRELRVQDGKKKLRAEVTFANTCDSEVEVDDLTLLGQDLKDGEDVIRRWDGDRVTVPRGGTATMTIEEVVRRGGDRSIALARWGWELNVEATAPRSTSLCFTTGSPAVGETCARIEKVTAAP
ncbi:hypothetical protein [Nannocystis bainbridge]|uniref:Uncharacterized protein n=1 Tax=Nannocystis bainbridge TaxID=2995303 RepID=A0ABT5EAD9_9BACT|nr:hypothetical protein [Nannocystis bainbridge]MDC0722819.1 hypothetical protein [Nannocystis bainbridge]